LQQTLTKTKASFEEEQDKEHRRKIFILYRLPQSNAQTVTGLAAEYKRFCEQLLIHINVGIADEYIRRVLRLGRCGRCFWERVDAYTNSVWLNDIEDLIMESLYKLKSLDSKFYSVIVSDCKALVEEAQQKW